MKKVHRALFRRAHIRAAERVKAAAATPSTLHDGSRALVCLHLFFSVRKGVPLQLYMQIQKSLNVHPDPDATVISWKAEHTIFGNKETASFYK